MDMTEDQIQQMITDALNAREVANGFGVSIVPYHTHNGTDSTQINANDLLNLPSGIWTEISSSKLTSNAALIIDSGTFAASYDMFRVTLFGIREGTVAGVGLQMRLNADSGGNYTYSWLDQYNAVSPDVNFTTGNTLFGITNGQTLGAGDTVTAQILIGKSTAAVKANILAESSFTDIPDSRYVKCITSGFWTNGLSKITQIQIGWLSDATTYWATGSTCLIEGFKN